MALTNGLTRRMKDHFQAGITYTLMFFMNDNGAIGYSNSGANNEFNRLDGEGRGQRIFNAIPCAPGRLPTAVGPVGQRRAFMARAISTRTRSRHLLRKARHQSAESRRADSDPGESARSLERTGGDRDGRHRAAQRAAGHAAS
jgi:hypothetical protein